MLRLAHFILLSVLWLALSSPPTQAAENFRPAIDRLASSLEERTMRVEEFHFLRAEAEKLGVRAWLFGGTAAAYAHYVKWDLQSEAGDKRYQRDRFDYDYLNIYRATQDLDIVIDGTAAQATELRTILQKKYPHLQGSKNEWEVRPLTQDMGDKLAILNNPNFLNQHSDSNSTGMVEVTKTPAGENAVRDVLDWENPRPQFLKDVHEGKLHYYFNPKHETTRFYKEGRNPPILSVIRYLTKAFQFELETRPEDEAIIKDILAKFNPKGKEMKNEYVRRWILQKEDGRKLVKNAVNLEYAIHKLEELGARKKLIAIEGTPEKADSFSYWLAKKPLKTLPVGRGMKPTAAALGITMVAHETNGFAAYESITKAHTGSPNVFTSRENAIGEAAIHGEGFYTRKGQEGARGTGFTIRFRVKPNARLGTDFTMEGDYIIFHNKAAFTVIPESLQWSISIG